MTRLLTVIVTAATLIAGTGFAMADAEVNPFFQLFGGGSRSGGAGPIARTTVDFPNNYAPGTIVVNTQERRLYLIQSSTQALRYGIGVGRDGFRWGGVHRITAKKEWPSWTPRRRCFAAARIFHATWLAVRTILSARGLCISAQHFIASMARTSLRPLDKPSRQAASVWSTTTSSISTIVFRSARP